MKTSFKSLPKTMQRNFRSSGRKVLLASTRCVFGTLYRRELRRPTNDSTFPDMADKDASQEALEQVEKITDSEPVNGEDLVESPRLKRALREAKERLAKESTEPASK